MKKITLYQYPFCPFCASVRSVLDELNLQFELVNVARDESDPIRKKIIEKSKCRTVPVIHVEDEEQKVWMGESRDIIKYLKNQN